MKLFIGTSGYSYPHWGNGVFYHRDVKQKDWLGFYSQQFNAVELNVTFYQVPDKATVKRWFKETPREFRFVVKGSRFITHIKRLKDVQQPLEKLWENMEPLRPKMDAFLWQLPPDFKRDDQRLRSFCRQLQRVGVSGEVRNVFEFRDDSWFCEEVYAILREFQCCLCFADFPQKMGEHVLTTDFAYVRFHSGKVYYTSNYSQKELEVWADKIVELRGRIKRFYAFFNNDEQAFAVYNAQAFRMLLFEKGL